ncbi:MAG: bifunctional phosphopantothenoylcysteine decarboxylase/phosphopantothenate--cysteine ligase CoaBC [Eggerthellaceae bacterium]|jgi:phosphopantothenoylcysteine decarboxylase/phosphopantothenate--cysteine ligase
MSDQKTVVLGVTGCIAAYKSCEILRALQKRNVRVKVVMTEHATHFVDPVTFRALTHEKVAVDLFDDPTDPIHHISLAQEADLFLIAPCTANVMAKLTYGLADDLLSTSALATTAPVMLAPAMNVHMYENPVTQENMAKLKARGVRFIEPDAGYLACGDVGKGRLAEPDDIADAALKVLEGKQDLAGKHVMITAGPTEEPIDPVRFITNRSSGKMGYSIAIAAAQRGAHVTLISGPVQLGEPHGVEVVHVQTAQQMYEAADAAFKDADIAIFSAAVADMRPAHPANKKLKKGFDDAKLDNVELVQNPDILATMGKKKDRQLVVGFAAETNDVVANGLRKLATKHADMIVANEVGHGKAFGTEGNEAWLLTEDENEHLPFMPKAELADVILDKSLQLLG